MKNVKNYLQDLLIELSDVATFTADGHEKFMQDRMAQKAVIRCYEVIGEISKRIPSEVRDTYPQIDWRKLTGFRDFLSHNYDMVILENVWQAIEDVANLRNAVEAMLSELDASETE